MTDVAVRDSIARLETGASDASGVSVARLTVTDFRCYDHLRLEPGPGPVVLTGPNGAGKTNILEALSFLVPGRGLRRARLDEPARRDAGVDADQGRAWAVAAHILTPSGPLILGTGRDDEAAAGRLEGGREKRSVRINGAAASQAALSEHLDVQWLTPRMDRLFMDGPAARRRFLDRLVAGFDPAHAGRVAAYERALRERVHVLRRDRPDPDWLAALEDTMAARGLAVTAARRELAARLDDSCRCATGPFPVARLSVEGAVESWLDDGPALDAEERLRDALAGSREKDRESGGAATGPHRSDLRVRHLGADAPAEQCSTGQQKALLIAIVLANARLGAAARGAAPLLLLDEVMAHLDEDHRRALFAEISDLGAQAWLTGTDAALFRPLQPTAQVFHVEDARVFPPG